MNNELELEVFVRAYTDVPGKPPVGSRKPFTGLDQPSEYTLIFDCETTTCPAQSLRVGSFQVRNESALELSGFFYEPATLNDAELTLLREHASELGFELMTVGEFRDFLLMFAYDLSRIALTHSEARGAMRGGFSFKLSDDRRKPSLRTKHLSRRAALIDFAAPAKQETPRGMRKRRMKVPHHRGYFIDLKTLAAALTSRNHSLSSLCEYLRTDTQKAASDDHGAVLTNDYLDYARGDVQATWECYQALMAEYDKHGLSTQPHRILSEASVGKAYLKEMGVHPLLFCQPDFPREIFGNVMCGYYGGRAEVRIRREIKRVLYCDFKSMYPTVNALMSLWKFVTAKEIKWRDSTAETQAFLDRVTMSDFQSINTWRQLTTLVLLPPDHDLLPVRAKYDGKSNTIGLNHLTCTQPLWYTLADCVAAKILSGKTPKIEEAVTFSPGEPQDGLQPINLFGNGRYRVDPLHDDVFKRFVDLRDGAKDNGDPAQQAIKIIANATSYGIFIEINRDDAPKAEPIDVYGPDTGRITKTSKALEEPGRYFNPIIGVLITGGARLMLAIAERLVQDAGLDWVFCDTDSIAIAQPDDMAESEFQARARTVIDWFEVLNPYEKAGSILKIEDVNYDIDDHHRIEPLFAYAISAKRYVLFNLDDNGRPVIRKASAHGLGQYMPLYGEKDAPASIPAPAVPLGKIGVERWHYDLWFKIIEAALNGHPDQVALDYHPALNQPAASRYGATSPRLLKWFKDWNISLPYEDQVKPFGFLVSFQGKNGLWRDHTAEPADRLPGRGRPTKVRNIAPVAPLNRDPMKAAKQAFDRETGESIPVEFLKTYAECLAQYHISPEAKFTNSDYMDSGRTERRHVIASNLRLIGKEGNRLDEFELDTNNGLFNVAID